MGWKKWTAAGLTGGASLLFSGKKSGGGGGIKPVEIAPFYTDEKFSDSQDLLFDVGKSILGGDIPEYIREVGEEGGDSFENMIKSYTKDISTGVNQQIAKTGAGRAGSGATSIARAISKVTPQLRWNERLRSLAGKMDIYGTGLNTTSGVRSSALQYAGQKNQYNLNKADLEMRDRNFLYEAEKAEEDKSNSMWKGLLKAGTRLALGVATGGASELAFTAAGMAGIDPLEAAFTGDSSALQPDFSMDGIVQGATSFAGNSFGVPNLTSGSVTSLK